MIRSIALTLSILALPCTSLALGLGKLDLQSKLNEPFKAKIELLSASADELDSLKVNLAGSEDFERAGVERSFNLTKLKFDIKETRGADYILITSNDLIREPFLNFLIEINWNRGRLLREYTALMDPPTYAPVVATAPTPVVTTQSQPKTIPVVKSTETTQKFPKKIPVVKSSPVDTSAPTVYIDESTGLSAAPTNVQPEPIISSSSYSSGDYTIAKGDTLWSIAGFMRPETSVSIQQTMMALYRNNGHAFEQNNINNLKTGQVLSAPELDEINKISKAEALRQALEHNGSWQGYRETLANDVAERPDSPGVSLPSSDDASGLPTESLEESEPELRLVGSDDTSTGVGQGSGDTGSSSAVSNDDVAIAQESLVALESENKELQDKLLEAESIIDDLNRLIVLKEDELSALRQQLSTNASEELTAEQPLEEMVDDPLPIEEDMTSPIEEDMTPPIVDEMMTEESSAIDESSQFIEEEPLSESDPSEYGELYDEEPGMEEAFPGETEVFDEEFAEPIAESMDEGFAEETLPEESPIEAQPAEPSVAETSTEEESSTGAMGMVQEYLGPVISFVQDNLTLVGSGLGGILALLLGYFGFKKFRSGKEEELELDEDDDILSFGEEDETDLLTDSSEGTADAEPDSNDTLVMDAPIDLSQPIESEESDVEKTAAHDFADSGPAGYAEPHAADSDEDPLAEVNVFLAYEHFDQAEEFVKNALQEQPDNLEFHTKLLEVYYASGDKKAYEDAAKVVKDKFGDSGEHWDNALAMWAEMSPNREIFTERADGLDDTQAIDPSDVDEALGSGSGIVDLTAHDPSAVPDSGLEETAADVLDITGQNIVPSKEETKTSDPQGLIDTLSEANDLETLSDSNILDVSTSGANELEFSLPSESAEHILDLTGGDGEEDILDITAGSQEDLLDVTASTDLDTLAALSTRKSDIEEENTLDFDVQALDLDVPGEEESSTDIGDSSIERAMDALEAEAESPSAAEESSIDFDLPLDLDGDTGSLDLDISGAHDISEKDNEPLDPSEAVTVEMEAASPEVEPTVELEQEEVSLDESDSFSVDLTLDSDSDEIEPTVKMDVSDEVTLDFDTHGQDTDDLKSDLGDITMDDEGGVDLDLTNEFTLDEENTDSLSDGFDLELEDEEEMIPNTELDIDMESTVELPEKANPEISENTTNFESPTVEMPKIDYMADDDDKTVFIPRSASSEQQSLEDEVSTKLDLAKAYVELGDNDSAKTILDEIVAEGNDEQKQIAQQLLDQV